CPEDCDTYLHRVGRTARYEAAGKGLLFLLPSEQEGMAKIFADRNIPIKEISAKSNKMMHVSKQLQHYCFQDPEIKYLGQRAFVTYVRSVFLQKNKSVFDVEQLPLEEFAEALGLPGAPKIKFVKKSSAKNKSYELENMVSPEEREKKRREQTEAIERENTAAIDEAAGEDGDDDEDDKVKTRVDKMFARKNAGVLADHYRKLVDQTEDNGDDDDNDFLTLKRADHDLSDDDSEEEASDKEAAKEQTASADDAEEPVVKTIAINPDTGLPVVIPNIPAQEMSKRQLRK
ncbi:ATP-dependent RNA helicase dbp4, partial [Linderina pennispora]